MSGCGSVNGDYVCELSADHDGRHEASEGFGWITWVAAPPVPGSSDRTEGE